MAAYRRVYDSRHMRADWRIHVVSPEEEKEGYDGKDLQKRKVLSLG